MIMRSAAFAILAMLFIASLLANFLAPAPYDKQFRETPDAVPCAAFPLGTDNLGRDRLSRLLYGTRVSLLLAPAAALLSLTIALAAGGSAALAGGWWDRSLTAIGNLILSLPWLFLFLTVRSVLPLNTAPAASLVITFALMGLLGWGGGARVIRAALLDIRHSQFALYARSFGCSPGRLWLRQLAPHLRSVMLAQFWLSIPAFILGEASLGILGLGVAEPMPSWGNLLKDLQTAPKWSEWWVFTPAALLCFVMVPLPIHQTRSTGRGTSMISRLLAALLIAWTAFGSGELRFALHHEPKTLDPLLADEDASETIRYLTSGFLIKINRLTQTPEPDLAESWKISADHRSVTFTLRPGLSFSDGTPFTASDVAATFQLLTNPALHSLILDSFTVAGTPPKVTIDTPRMLTVLFGGRVEDIERLFDQLAIVSPKSPAGATISMGPFYLESYKPGVELLLKRNPHYWKKDGASRNLPYLDSVRLPIQSNREIELNRFRAGELDLINSIDSDSYDRLAKAMPGSVHDNGPSADVEFLWFNLAPSSPLPQYKKDWFASAAFRHAISASINREDICRLVYRGHGRPAAGLFSPSNRTWFNTGLKAQPFDPAGALKSLAAMGFSLRDGVLKDRAGNPVEFSVVTNTGNKARERMATLIQQDLRGIGVKLNIVSLEMLSLIDRLTKSSQYEACLLGMVNVNPDPTESMNVLLSSGRQHAWNPSQTKPSTAWEAEIDTLMRGLVASPSPAKRKGLFDRVQEILQREEPSIYLVNRNSLSAVSPRVQGVQPAHLFPETFWNIDRLSVK